MNDDFISFSNERVDIVTGDFKLNRNSISGKMTVIYIEDDSDSFNSV